MRMVRVETAPSVSSVAPDCAERRDEPLERAIDPREPRVGQDGIGPFHAEPARPDGIALQRLERDGDGFAPRASASRNFCSSRLRLERSESFDRSPAARSR
jgi:hypothetical protein